MNYKEFNIKESLGSFFDKREDETRICMINFLYGGKSKLNEPKIVVSERLIGSKTKRTLNLFVNQWENLTENTVQ